MISTSSAATVTTSISGGRTATGSPSSFWSVAAVEKNGLSELPGWTPMPPRRWRAWAKASAHGRRAETEPGWGRQRALKAAFVGLSTSMIRCVPLANNGRRIEGRSRPEPTLPSKDWLFFSVVNQISPANIPLTPQGSRAEHRLSAGKNNPRTPL